MNNDKSEASLDEQIKSIVDVQSAAEAASRWQNFSAEEKRLIWSKMPDSVKAFMRQAQKEKLICVGCGSTATLLCDGSSLLGRCDRPLCPNCATSQSFIACTRTKSGCSAGRLDYCSDCATSNSIKAWERLGVREAIKPWRPANSSEEASFYEEWCDQCEKQQDDCTILEAGFIGDQPSEWQHKDLVPECTAYSAREAIVK